MNGSHFTEIERNATKKTGSTVIGTETANEAGTIDDGQKGI